MADVELTHAKVTTLPDNPAYDISSAEWNEPHKFSGGATGALLYSRAAAAIGASWLPDVAVGNVLLSGGVGAAPAYGQIDLAAHITGNLPVAHLAGGVGASATTFWRGDGTWVTPAGGGGTPGGSVTQVQFHDTGAAFGGDPQLTWDKTANLLTLAGRLDATTLGSSVVLSADDAYGAGWNASLALPTKNAIYDKIESLVTGNPFDQDLNTTDEVQFRQTTLIPSLGPELLINPGFTGSAAPWTHGPGWAYGANAVTHTPGDEDQLTQTGLSLIAGEVHRVSITVSGMTSGELGLTIGGTIFQRDIEEDGTFVDYVVVGDDDDVNINPSNDFDGTVDEVSVKHWPAALMLGWPGGAGVVPLNTLIREDADALTLLLPQTKFQLTGELGRSTSTLFIRTDVSYAEDDAQEPAGVEASLVVSGGFAPHRIYGYQSDVGYLGTSAIPVEIIYSALARSVINGAVTDFYNFFAELEVQDDADIGAVYGNAFRITGTPNPASLDVLYAFYSMDIAGWSANPYYFWADSRGVFRIREDNDQAIPALYNPTFTKYTPGAADYERGVMQWDSDTYQLGAEAGGTGVLRPVEIIGASLTTAPLILPTSDPGVSGSIWNNAGTVAISV